MFENIETPNLVSKCLVINFTVFRERRGFSMLSHRIFIRLATETVLKAVSPIAFREAFD